MDADRVAVIDIGSNSGRILVVRIDENGHLDVLETEGTPLRLVHELATSASLGEAVVERTIEALQGFKAIARGAGAERTLAVATAAVREAINGEQFVERLRCDDRDAIRHHHGRAEARYGFLGAAYGRGRRERPADRHRRRQHPAGAVSSTVAWSSRGACRSARCA